MRNRCKIAGFAILTRRAKKAGVRSLDNRRGGLRALQGDTNGTLCRRKDARIRELEQQLDECQLRRQETVAMCEQLRRELDDVLRKCVWAMTLPGETVRSLVKMAQARRSGA